MPFDFNGKESEYIDIGKEVKHQAEMGHNPPSWVSDEEAWNKAKLAAEGSYDTGSDTYWAVVSWLYLNKFGGTKISKQSKIYKKKIEEIKTYKINAVEVFSSGKWNEDEYTPNDLYSMVDSFNSLKHGFRPYLKLGHDDKQNLIKSSGLPSIGWVEKLYVVGSKLMADLNYIPEKVYKLIKSRAYRKVSCEIYWNLTVEGKKYSRVLGGIALLGCENPGVMNLDDILGNYSFNWDNNNAAVALFEKQDNFKTYRLDLNSKMGDAMTDEKTEKELALEHELDVQKKNYELVEADKKKLTDEKSVIEKENEDLKKYKIEAEQREATALLEAEEAKRAQFVSELEGKKLVTPAMKNLVSQLLTDKKEYSINDKTMSKNEIVEEILKLATESSKINFEEKTRSDFGKNNKVSADEEDINKYMQEHKCNYVQAYKAVMKEKENK